MIELSQVRRESRSKRANFAAGILSCVAAAHFDRRLARRNQSGRL